MAHTLFTYVFVLGTGMSTMVVAETAPPELLRAVLGETLAEPTACLSDLEVEPILTDGYSSNRLCRARAAWAGGVGAGTRPVTWLVKRWLPSGQRLPERGN